jgi:GGDEF domain-containing protein
MRLDFALLGRIVLGAVLGYAIGWEREDRRSITSVSIGISVFPLDAYDKGELLSHADAAMYQAKDAGGGHHKIFGSDRR